MRALSALGVGVIVVTGCASQRPVLYPNEHIRRVGGIAADRDIDDCIRRAEESRSAADAKAVRNIDGGRAIVFVLRLLAVDLPLPNRHSTVS